MPMQPRPSAETVSSRSCRRGTRVLMTSHHNVLDGQLKSPMMVQLASPLVCSVWHEERIRLSRRLLARVQRQDWRSAVDRTDATHRRGRMYGLCPMESPTAGTASHRGSSSRTSNG